MKIAIALDGDLLSTHFGHCERFLICDIQNQLVIKRDIENNPCLSPNDLPEFLKQKDIATVISAGIGGGAIAMLERVGIESIRVEILDVDEVIKYYVSGDLIDLGSKCDGKFR